MVSVIARSLDLLVHSHFCQLGSLTLAVPNSSHNTCVCTDRVSAADGCNAGELWGVWVNICAEAVTPRTAAGSSVGQEITQSVLQNRLIIEARAASSSCCARQR